MATRRGGDDASRLYERDVAVATLESAVAAARRGEGRAVFLEGEAGLGKTTLLEVARDRHGAGLALRTARGNAMERDLPFAFMEQALGFFSPPSSEWNEADNAASTEVGAEWEALGRRTEVYALARSRLRRLANDGPVLFLLDDIHWADPDSLRLLLYLVRRSAQLPVALVGSLRPWPSEARMAIGQLAAEGQTLVVHLPALSEPASAQLLESLTARALEGDQAQRAWRLTDGNPLLLVEAARVLRDDGRLPASDGGVRTSAASTLLLSHVAGLPPDAVGVAQAAAALGRSFLLGVLQTVSGLEREAFAEAFDITVAAGLLRGDGAGRGAFHHELVAASIDKDTPPARRRLLHLRAFEHYVDVGDEESAVPHVLAGGLVVDPRVGPLLARAGARALRDGAVETGLTHLRRAVEISDPAASDGLLESLADALFLAGHFDEALGVYRRLLARVLDAEHQATVATKEARALVYSGHLDEAMAVFERLIADAIAAGDGRRVAPLLVERGHAIWETGGPAAAEASLQVADGLDLPTPHREPLEGLRATFRFHIGDLSGLPELERQATAARQMSLAGHSPDPGLSTNSFMQHVAASAALERFDEAEMYVRVGLEQFAGAGALLPSVPLRLQRIGILLMRGALAAAMAELDDVNEELDVGSLLLPYFLQMRARALCFMGDFIGSARARREAMGLAGGHTWFVAIALGMAEGHALLFNGEAERSSDVFARIETVAADHGVGNPGILMWPTGAIESGLAAGRLDQVARVLDTLKTQTRDFGTAWPQLLAFGGRAGLAAAAGDDEAAERLYEQALAVPCAVLLDRLGVAVRYGRWLRQHHQSRRARPVLADALRTAEGLGARPFADAAHAELAAAGGRRRRAGTGTGTGPGGSESGGGALTVQQARVAELAVTGATTKEIAQALHLSPRTVESHLAAVFVRLSVRSKSELRRRRAEFEPQLGLGARP
ncbi:MAG TPA: AAA family ATPase [Acidimicrobiales bacterium]|nr:AAA family ATPase [Acidimicrobiales bacterium]